MSEHEAGQHALLSPSAAERWLSCPASVRISAMIPGDNGSDYAAEGTLAHSVGEFKCRKQILDVHRSDDDDLLMSYKQEAFDNGWDWADIDHYTDRYVAFIRERLEAVPNSVLLLEQRVYSGIEQCDGTADAIIVSPTHVEIVDFKYGMGVAVIAEGNPQLRIYGVGALEGYGEMLGEPETVTTTVYQPRLGGHAMSETLSTEDLKTWRDGIRPTADEAREGSDRFGPSDEACRWCPAKGQCRAQMEWSVARDFNTDPELLDADDIAEAIRMIPAIRKWCDALLDVALDKAYSRGVVIPGYKVVLSGGRRGVTKPEPLVERAGQIGYARATLMKEKLIGIGELEKLLGKDFDLVTEGCIEKSTGKPSLVPVDDPKPSINPEQQAKQDFQVMEDDA